jgi:hypothetical protein
VVVLFGALRFVLAMVGVVARVVIKVKIDIKNGFGIWLFLSSQDTNNTKSNTQHKNLNVSYTLYGTNSSNLSGSISRDSSTSTSQQTTHNNTNLTAQQ